MILWADTYFKSRQTDYVLSQIDFTLYQTEFGTQATVSMGRQTF